MRRFLVSTLCLMSVAAGSASELPCPAPFQGQGDATFFTLEVLMGACSVPWSDGDHIAAINYPQWAGSAHCGECLRVTGPLGSTVVKIVDQCPGCIAGDVDLSPAAFQAIANPILGRVPVQWERVECPVAGNLAFKFKSGANNYALILQALDYRYGVTSMSIYNQGAYQPMSREDYNYFTYASGEFKSPPFQIRLTATTGEVVEQSIQSLANEVVQQGTTQFTPCTILFADGFE